MLLLVTDEDNVSELLNAVQDQLDSTFVANRKEMTREAVSEGRTGRSIWGNRMFTVETRWVPRTESIIEEDIKSQAFPTGKCDYCSIIATPIIKCLTCRDYFCPTCDLKIHQRQVFHDRRIFRKDEPICLAENTFLSADGGTELKGNSFLYLHNESNLSIFKFKTLIEAVHLPCFKPSHCVKCNAAFSLTSKAGGRDVAVISFKGTQIFLKRNYEL